MSEWSDCELAANFRADVFGDRGARAGVAVTARPETNRGVE